MKKEKSFITLIITFLLFITPFWSVAQNPDSVRASINDLKVASFDSIATEKGKKAIYLSKQLDNPQLLFDANKWLGTLYRKGDRYDIALHYYDQAMKSAPRTSNAARSTAIIHYLVGITKKAQGAFDDAMKALNQSEKLFEEDDPLILIVYNAIGGIYTDEGKYVQALEYLSRSYKAYKSLNDTIQIAKTQYKLANLYHKLDRYKQAYALAKRSLDVLKQTDDVLFLSNIYNTLGAICIDLEEYEEAEVALNSGLLINNIPQRVKAHIFNNLGSLYNGKKDYDSALEYYTESYQLFENLNQKGDCCTVSNNIGKIHYNKEEYKKAIIYFSKCLNAESRFYHLMDQYANIGAAYRWLGEQDSALHYWQRYDTMRVFIENAKDKAEELDAERREKENLLLENSNLKKTQQLSNNRAYWLVSLSITLFASLFLFQRLHNKRQLAEKDRILAEQKAVNIMKEVNLKTNYARLSGQDEERKKIAQELHDNVGAILSTIKIYFGKLGRKIDYVEEKNKQRYEEAFELLDTAYDEIRRISQRVSDANLAKYGLGSQLEKLAKTIERATDEQMQINLKLTGLEQRIEDFRVEENVYSIIFELVNNAMKHAEASKINITVKQIPDGQLMLSVEDNGIGLDVKKKETDSGIGLMNIEARVDDLGGQIAYHSIQGKGTSIVITDINLN